MTDVPGPIGASEELPPHASAWIDALYSALSDERLLRLSEEGRRVVAEEETAASRAIAHDALMGRNAAEAKAEERSVRLQLARRVTRHLREHIAQQERESANALRAAKKRAAEAEGELALVRAGRLAYGPNGERQYTIRTAPPKPQVSEAASIAVGGGGFTMKTEGAVFSFGSDGRAT